MGEHGLNLSHCAAICRAGAAQATKPLTPSFKHLPTCPTCTQPIGHTIRYQRIINKRALDLLDAKAAMAVIADMQRADLALMKSNDGATKWTLEALTPVYQVYEKAIQEIGLPSSMQVGVTQQCAYWIA